MIKISVTIPAYNESGGILETLNAFNKQTGYGFEVILVNNNSTDDTRAVVEAFIHQANYSLKILDESSPGVGHARKKGADDALERKIPILAGTDADCDVHPDWIKGILEAFEDESIAVLAGKYVHSIPRLIKAIETLPPKVQKKLVDLFELNNLILEHTLRSPLLTGSNFAVRADAYRAAGGFEQPYLDGKPAPQEDWNLGKKLGELGYTTVFAKTENPSDPRRILEWLATDRDAVYEENLTHIRPADFLQKLSQVSDERMALRLRKVIMFHLVSPIIKKMAPPEDAGWFLGERLEEFVSDVRTSKVLESEDADYRAKIREQLLDTYTPFIIEHLKNLSK
jgi:glycosyltransferase involved in cell wall biosynthesis